MTILLTIIHTNDLHANYDSWLQQAALVRARKVELEAAGGKYLLVEGGDHLDMSVNECIATSGRMNMVMIAELLDRFTMVKEVFVDYLKRESLSRIGLER
jgi:5'-nucleotidase